MSIGKDKIRAYALKNAIHYKGKANAGAVISGLFAEGLKREEVKDYSQKIKEIVDEVNKISFEEQEKDYENFKDLVSERDIREGLPELPDVPKLGVVMRFRPAPSGPLYIGHIISNLISSMYVKKYGGKFYIIIDDTSPETTLKDSYKNIKEDCDWIFGNVSEYINSSDRMDLYYGYAVSLIEEKSAYICTCSAESFKELATRKENCPCRKKTVKENISDWEKMISKKSDKNFKQGEAILRFKTPEKYGGMKHKNPAMRDFPLARINETKHPLQGNKYRVWPLMNLVVAVDDMDFGMTHIIRGKDHRDNAERQKMIFEIFGKEYPWTSFIGRIKFTDLVLSKRKITALIDSGEFSGADDEKLPTISSLRKRGYKPEAFEKFVEQRGLTEVDKVISSKDFFEIIDNFNKR
jgi:glutamyl-tRNA synthetase